MRKHSKTHSSEKEEAKKEPCCSGASVGVFPLVLITVGVIFLAQNMGIIDDAWNKLWPVIIIMVGLGLIVKRSKCNC